MSAVRPYTEAQAAAWRARGPEPVSIELDGWERSEPAGCLPNERLVQLRRGRAAIALLRFWDWPLGPGHPMAEAGSRPVQVDGRELELVETSMFEGAPRRVHLLFIRGDGWLVRVVFEGCGDDEIAAACAAIQIT